MKYVVHLLEYLGVVRSEIGVGRGENQVSSQKFSRNFLALEVFADTYRSSFVKF